MTRARLTAMLACAAAIVALAAWQGRRARPAAAVATRSQDPARAAQAPARAARAAADGRVLARLEGRALTAADLRRYQAVRELTAGVLGEQQALDELRERTAREALAGTAGVQVDPLELERRLLRARLAISASAPDASPAAASAGPFARAERLLASRALDGRDLEREVMADALAAAVARRPELSARLEELRHRWREP